MKRSLLIAIFLVASYLWLGGCGGAKSVATTPPPVDICSGVAISGRLQDSLTGQVIPQAAVYLESGIPLSGSQLINFDAIQQTVSDNNGTFKFCANTVVSPSAIVAVAADLSGNVYPPFVTSISQTVDLGNIPMGGCQAKCGFEGQQQTSLPATISGVITTSPVAKSGTVFPRYAIKAVDGSETLWNLAIPTLQASSSTTFTSGSVGCDQGVSFCSAYSFALPSENAIYPVKGGYSQQTGSPIYSISAAITGTPSCVPSSAAVYFQPDAQSPLQASPGAKITVAPINFHSCQ